METRRISAVVGVVVLFTVFLIWAVVASSAPAAPTAAPVASADGTGSAGSAKGTESAESATSGADRIGVNQQCRPGGFRMSYEDTDLGKDVDSSGRIDDWKRSCLAAGLCWNANAPGQPPCYINTSSPWDGVRRRRAGETATTWFERIMRTIGGALGKHVDNAALSDAGIAAQTGNLTEAMAQKICCGADADRCDGGACGGGWFDTGGGANVVEQTKMCDCLARKAVNF